MSKTRMTNQRRVILEELRKVDTHPTVDELYAIVKETKAFCDTHGMEMDFTSPGLIPREKLEALGLHVPLCGAGLSNMAIAPDGTVIPCQSWLKADAGLGNLLKDDWKAIWKHPRCQKRSRADGKPSRTQRQAACGRKNLTT